MEWITINRGDDDDPDYALGFLDEGHVDVFACCDSLGKVQFLREAVTWYQSFLEAGTLALPAATPVKKSRNKARKKSEKTSGS